MQLSRKIDLSEYTALKLGTNIKLTLILALVINIKIIKTAASFWLFVRTLFCIIVIILIVKVYDLIQVLISLPRLVTILISQGINGVSF